jgi:hypothetical protein
MTQILSFSFIIHQRIFSLSTNNVLYFVLSLFSSSQRRTEKKILNTLNSKIRFPLEGRFVNSAMKINCLIQVR